MTILKSLKKHRIAVLLFLILGLGLLLRLLFFENATFGYDQARDALVARKIFLDDPIKIQGPTTDIQGLFHGSLYWYVIAPFYLLFQGNPLGPRTFLILLNLTNILFIYFLSKKFFARTSIALISAFIFAVSFEAVQYARWLSNPTPALFSIAVFYYGAWLVIQKNSKGLGLMLVGAAVSMQFQFFLVYLSFLFVLVTGYYLKHKPIKTVLTRINILLSAAAFLFYSPFLISELKFNFQATNALFNFFSKAGSETKDPAFVFQKFSRFWDSLVSNTSYNIVDFNRTVPLMVLCSLFIFIAWHLFTQKKERVKILFLTFWLVSPGLLYPFEKNNAYFLNIGNIYPLIMLTAFLIEFIRERLPKSTRQAALGLLLGIIAISNVSLIIQNNKFGETLFSVQSNVNLEDQKRMIDWMYEKSGKKPFSVNSVTNPLFINTTWSYLFNWYGNKKYGYMPIWAGYPQVGVFGSEIKFSDSEFKPGINHFLIMEPATGIPHEYALAYRVYEHSRGRFIESQQFGEFNVERRILENNMHFQRDELVKYLPNQDTLEKPLGQ